MDTVKKISLNLLPYFLVFAFLVLFLGSGYVSFTTYLWLAEDIDFDPGQWAASADTVYLIAFYRDLFVDNYRITGWVLPPSPYWFPDAPIQFASMAFFNNVNIALLINWLVFPAWFCFFLYLFLGEIISSGNEKVIPIVISLSTGIVWYLAILIAPNNYDFLEALKPGFHGAAAIIVLPGILLLNNMLAEEGRGAVSAQPFWKSSLVFFILIGLTLFSDHYLLLVLCAPGLAFLLLYSLWKHRFFWKTIGVLLFTIVFWLYLEKRFIGLNIFVFNTFDLFDTPIFETVGLAQAIEMLDIPPLTSVSMALWLITLVLLLAFEIKSYGGVRNLLNDSHHRNGIHILLMVNFWCLIVFPLICVCLIWLVYSPARYFAGSVVLSLSAITINVTYLLANYKFIAKRNNIGLSSAIIASILTIAFLLQYPSRSLDSVFEFKPAQVRCVEKLAMDRGWKLGFGGYWYASPMRVYSDVVDVNHLTPYAWIGNYYWQFGESPPPVYRFVSTNGVEVDKFVAQFGSPSSVYKCGENEIYEYDESVDDRLRERFDVTEEEIRQWRVMTGR